MANVADDGHDEILEAALVATNREQVEQALRRVRDVRFPGVQYADVFLHVPRDVGRDPRARVANHHDVAAHGLEGVDRIEDALALLARRRVDVEVEHVGAEAFAREVERCAGARAGFEKQVGHGAPGERVAVRRKAVGRRQVTLGVVEHRDQQRLVQALQRQQVTQAAVVVQLQARIVFEDLFRLGSVHRAGILH